MSFGRRVAARSSIASELLLFFWRGKWWWITPIVVAMLVFAVFIVLAQSSPLAPFIYTLF
ncbi:MAG TPA: DUF5989 family protein [Bryobacteraceae bacterium]|nr:DUF5989 family protein [Bryobacteraceae bacterium]